MADAARQIDNNDLTDFNAAQETVGGLEYQIVKLDVGDVGGAVSRLIRGQQTKANSLPVTLASDEDAPSTRTSSSSTETTGTATTSAGDKVAANSNRVGGYVQNLDSSIAIHVSFGGTATTSYTKIHPGGSIALDVGGVVWTGAVNLISASGTPAFVIVEFE